MSKDGSDFSESIGAPPLPLPSTTTNTTTSTTTTTGDSTTTTTADSSTTTTGDSTTTTIDAPGRFKMGLASALSPRRLGAALALLLGILAFHPSLLRLMVSSEESAIEMNYVQNFYLWTRQNTLTPHEITVGSTSSVVSSHFKPSRKTFIIVHGFLGSGLDNWILELKDALLMREDSNVISVSWSSGSMTATYFVINGRVPGVGQDTAKIITFLEETTGMPRDQVHLIGHSLGAHAVGFAGKSLNGTLSRITGLDPAGLSFHVSPPTERLDRTDAEFVDVIHTHGCTTILSQWTDCYGIDQNLGDADFWPNGGERQPACGEGGDGVRAVQEGSSCDHGMAYVFYTHSVKYPPSSTRFLARPCISWRIFNSGACPCNKPAQYMGYNVNPTVPGVFYLNTSLTEPYGILDSHCSPGAFSTIQIIVLVMLSVVLVLMALIVTATIVQQYCRVPMLHRVREALKIESATIHGFSESPSSQLLATAEVTAEVTTAETTQVIS